MRSYGQFCPVAKAAEVFCERWTPLILRELATGAHRFAEIQRGVPLASPSLLTRRLRQLEDEHIIERRKSESGRSWTYHLTPAGEEFVPIVEALGMWGQHWSRRDLAENEISLELLLWSMEKDVRPEAFSHSPAVVEVEFTDQPEAKRHWWFLNHDNCSELCLQEPGHEVDVYVQCKLPDLIHVWRGDIELDTALATDRVVTYGKREACRELRHWLGLSPLAGVKSRRDELDIS